MAHRPALLAALLVAAGARAAPPPAAALPGLGPSVDGGFSMEPHAAIDDVFGDSAQYRRIVDRFLLLADSMQQTREQFGKAVQLVLVEVSAGPGKPRPRRCPESTVAGPYARALELGQSYLKAGRELGRRYDQVKDFDRLGETAGLTADYRAKVKAVHARYQALLVDYREMKAVFHDQLADEVRFAGCDLDRLLGRAAELGTDEAWAPPAIGESAEGQPAAEVTAPPPPAAPAQEATAPPAAAPDRAGIVFYIDNTRCAAATRVAIDGRPLGEVPGATRAAYQTTAGPHSLCLLPVPTGAAPTRRCGDTGTVRKGYLHEGWTISLRCE
jgi:hypothetical protein